MFAERANRGAMCKSQTLSYTLGLRKIRHI
jgi:hypothetical protein